MATRTRNKGRHRYHGTRHWGRGNIKHGRGKGSQGGAGFGGSHKQKRIYMIVHHPDHFGREPMASLRKERMKTVNIWELNMMALEGKLKKGGDGKFVAEMPDCKVLGAGKLSFPIAVRADSFSKCAVEKIKEAGGEAKAG